MKRNTEQGKNPDKTLMDGLSEPQQAEVERRAAIGAIVVHEAVRKEGEEELRRPPSALAWSGFAAGMSMSFCLIGEGVIRAYLPDQPWARLVSSFGYTLGFLIVVLGRQQLFTENTLTVILPLLTRRDLTCLLDVLRLWLVVLVANLAGVFLITWAVNTSVVFEPGILSAFLEIGRETMTRSPGQIFVKAIFAGWLIALMVWLLPAAESARVSIVVILTYFVTLCRFPHVIAGTSEAFSVVVAGETGFWRYFLDYLLPTLAGNTVGGVSLVAALNHAQVIAGKKELLP